MMKFNRKTIRDFMQNVMRPRLLLNSKFNRELLLWYISEDYLHKPMSIDDKVEFFNALHDYCIMFVSFFHDDFGTRYVYFSVDPVNREEWDRAMNSIYQEE